MKIKKSEIIDKISSVLESINFKYKDNVINNLKKITENAEYDIFDTEEDGINIISEIFLLKFKEIYPNITEEKLKNIIKNHETIFWSNKLFEASTNYAWRRHFLEEAKKLGLILDPGSSNIKIYDDCLVFLPPLKERTPAYSEGSIPIQWFCTFVFDKYIGQMNEQGILNGPDFLFNDIKNNQKVGVEIAYLIKNRFTYDRTKIKNIDNFRKCLKNKLNFNLVFDNAKKIIEKHSNSIDKYVKCDKYYLLLLTSGNLQDIVCALLEYYCNDDRKTNCDRWEHIYII